MLVGRILGWLLILGAIIVVGTEVYVWLDQGIYHITAAGELWYKLSPSTLNLTQAVVQRYITPLIWDYGFRPVLLMPAWLALAVLGALILVIFRRRVRRRRHSSGLT